MIVCVCSFGFVHQAELASIRAVREVMQHKEILDALEAIKVSQSSKPALPPIPGDEKYYFVGGGVQQGPCSIENLRAMHGKGMISDSSWVLKEGASEWQQYVDAIRA